MPLDPNLGALMQGAMGQGAPGAQVSPEEMPTMQMDPNDPMGMQGQQEQAMVPTDPSQELSMPVEEYIQDVNLARHLKDKKDNDGNDILATMASQILDGIKLDEGSREDWMKDNEEALKLALLITEEKTWPWPRASNIKYPLIATAAIQFSARAYPALVPADGGVVKARAVPSALNEMFLDAAGRVGRHMSWQLMVKDPSWEQEMDKLLMSLAVMGSMFKKTYYDSVRNQNCSYLIYPKDFIVDFHATSLEKAYRKTEVIRLLRREIVEKVLNDEEFLDIEYGDPQLTEQDQERLENKDTAPSVNKATPHTFYQCHTFWDLDDDGYEEPVVVTIHKATEKVVKINARFTDEMVSRNEKGEILRINPLEYYTAFTFIENPSGSLYGIGFGKLLLPLNISINALINLLVDAGVLNNLQSGFLSKSLRLNMKNTPMSPGEWRVTQASGEELKNGLVPLPTKEPSAVLLQLAQMLISCGMQLASVAEIFVGKMPGQNTPATTTQQTVEQSMAVFTAVYKRVYRSLASEFAKLKYMNKINPTLVQTEAQESGLDVSPKDYSLPPFAIVPGADPSGDSIVIKQQKFAWVAQYILPLQTIDPMALTQWGLEIMEIPNYQKLLPKAPPQPPPDPEAESRQQEMQMAQQKHQMDMESKAAEKDNKEKLIALELAAKQQKLQQSEQEGELKLRQKAKEGHLDLIDTMNKARAEAQSRNIKSAAATHEAGAKFAENRQAHKQKMEHQRATTAAKLKQQKASASKTKSKSKE